MIFEVNRKDLEVINVKMDAGAVQTIHGSNVMFSSNVTLQSDRKYGDLKLNLSQYTQQSILLNVLLNGKVVRSFPFDSAPNTHLLEHLKPGDYTFNIVLDKNQNGKWDVGDRKKLLQPEVVVHFSTPVTVRANWAVDLELIPNVGP